MHDAVLAYVSQQVNRYGLRGDVLDLGGRDVNGTVHSLFPDARWTVVDIAPHPTVDVVADAADLALRERFDVVIATELFEHTARAAEIVASAHRHLHPGGCFLATMAGPGRHPHGASGEPAPPPGEWYRNVTPDDLALWLVKAGFDTWKLDQEGLDLRVVAWKAGDHLSGSQSGPPQRHSVVSPSDPTAETSGRTVDVIVPVLHRPQNVEPFMNSLKASTDQVTAWFVVEPDDHVEWTEVERCGGQVLAFPGSFAQKVNHAYQHTHAPWLFLVGDDVLFRRGWVEHAFEVAERTGGAVIGTNDLGNPAVLTGNHATHMLIRRDYIDQMGASFDGPGVVCHEGYRHWHIDDEIIIAAKLRGVWQPSLLSIVEHLHPFWGKSEDDDVYRAGRAHVAEDQALFADRLRQVQEQTQPQAQV